MKKSWGLTIVFAALLGIVSAVYFLSSPPSTTPVEKLSDRVLGDLTSERVTKIEVARKDGTSLTFERSTDPLGEYWRLAGTRSPAAELALVQQMLFGLDRFLKAGALEPGKPESAPDLTGLADPRLTVTFVSAGRRDVLRFGKPPPTNGTVVCYQHEGDPKIYLVGVDTFEAFNKPAAQYRARQLVRYQPHRAIRVEMERRFERAPKKKSDPPTTEYEISAMDRFEEGSERGWYLTKPHREKLDDHRVAALVTELANLPASDYQEPGPAKEQGLDEPDLRVRIFLNGEPKPIEVHFGAETDHGRKRWVTAVGSGEVALTESFRYGQEIPNQRSSLRTTTIFTFSQDIVKTFAVEVKDLGKVVVERRELKKEGDAVGTLKWEVVEPAGLRVDQERVEAFVTAVLSQQIVSFLGAQDFKYVGLDPAPIQLRIETRQGKKHEYGFSGTSKGFMRKEGIEEIFEVRPELVKMLQRLELNFGTLEMFNVLRESLREFTFESRASAQLQPIFYRMKFDEAAKKWAFSDPAHQAMEADADAVGGLLAVMNYIRAESLIGRDPKTIKENRLEEGAAPSTLKIVHKDGVAELLISEDLSGKPGQPVYNARFRDNSTVFRINGIFVESLKRPPVLKKDEPKKEGGEKDK